MELIGWWLVK